MKLVEEPLPGCLLLQPDVHMDRRGFFYEFFNQKTFEKITGLSVKFVQDNLAESQKNVLRGMHFQKEPYAQSKLISVVQGKLLDVVVDLRRNSPTFLKYYQIVLSDENKLQLFIPKGFAHGYLALSDQVKIFYKTDAFYHPEYDAGFRFDDPHVNIPWPGNVSEFILSEKDMNLPSVEQILNL